MDRKTFIKNGCIACSNIGFLSTILQSCASVKYTAGRLTDNGLLLDPKMFYTKKNSSRSYVIVRHDDLQYPICVYKIDDNNYSAVLMRCSHQGAELQVSGDTLTCPAHGSEFDKYGKVMQMPAMDNLRSFPVSKMNDELFIDLRKPA
jgi:Rieske Fe-S protein